MSGLPVLVTANYLQVSLEALPENLNPAQFEKADHPTLPKGFNLPNGRRFVIQGDVFGYLESTDGSVQKVIDTVGAFGAARIVGVDRQGNTYVIVEDLAPVTPITVELTIRRYDPNGVQTGVALLPGDYDSNPRRMIEVTPEGEIYALVPRLSGTAIYKVSLGSTYTSAIPQIVARAAATGKEGAVWTEGNVYGCFKGYNSSNNIDNSRATVRIRWS